MCHFDKKVFQESLFLTCKCIFVHMFDAEDAGDLGSSFHPENPWELLDIMFCIAWKLHQTFFHWFPSSCFRSRETYHHLNIAVYPLSTKVYDLKYYSEYCLEDIFAQHYWLWCFWSVKQCYKQQFKHLIWKSIISPAFVRKCPEKPVGFMRYWGLLTWRNLYCC